MLRASRWELAVVPKLIMELMKECAGMLACGWWDSNVFRVGTSAVKGTTWGGGRAYAVAADTTSKQLEYERTGWFH